MITFAPKFAVCGLSALVLLCLVQTARAETFALLVGVGDYAMGGQEIDLPGIDKDIAMMRSVVRTLGVKPNNIRVHLDQQATREKVVATFKHYARELKPSDDLLVYFSTHGIQLVDTNGDEVDGVDEALALHDLALHNEDGIDRLRGVISDDELGRLLNDISSRRKVVIIDACHSGTMSKSFDIFSDGGGKAVKNGKSLSFPQLAMPANTSKALGLTGDNVVSFDDLLGNADTVVISAARDIEEAVPSASGSLFTKSLSSVINVIRRKTPYCWYRSVQHVVATESQGRQHPVLLGGFIQSNQVIGASHFNYRDAAHSFTDCDNGEHVELAPIELGLSTDVPLGVLANVKRRGWFYLLAVQDDSIAVLPWRHATAQSAANEVYLGEQSLLADLVATEALFKPGPMLILGIWLQNKPEERDFNWSTITAGDVGEVSTTMNEFTVTRDFAR